MRYFMVVMGIIIGLTFLLAILAGSAQANEAVPAAGGAQPKDATPLIYVALVGGAALLAGVVWLGTLRRIQQPMEKGPVEEASHGPSATSTHGLQSGLTRGKNEALRNGAQI